ncbi:hypothetical protein PMAYCL1PPCAC_20264 [Pristionchus mayeri]|uniref:Nuclear receptor n=1 Tax=Pristionchus mayeri TaxID=1317129 RepID=A0AAN5I393_9BILA|nr:hypothetical protein PMAYCL1PPCAC_20264 [Pristionchus mayeri]
MADQLCLVCDTPTKHSHLEVQICRACKLFYKRSEKRKRPLRCRSSKGQCRKTPRCKKCRFQQIDRLVRGLSEGEDNETAVSPTFAINPGPLRAELSQPSKLLEQVRLRYRMMSLSRQAAELSELHPGSVLTSALDDKHVCTIMMPLKPCTITTVNYTMRLLVSSLFDFAANLFEEFNDLSKEHKWFLIKNFHYPFWLLESAFRVKAQFPHLRNFHFMSLTTYMNDACTSSFVDIAPRTPTAKQEGGDLVRSYFRSDVSTAQNAVRKAEISTEELFALFVLIFWDIENTTTDEYLLSLAEKYRRQVLAEFQELHRRSRREEECAKRIGELMGLIVVLQDITFAMPMNLEMLRVLNIFDDNTTMYQLTRNGMPPGTSTITLDA